MRRATAICAVVLGRGREARRSTPEVRDCAGALQGPQAGSEGVPLPLSQHFPPLDRWLCPPPLVRALSTSDAFSAVKESSKCPTMARMRLVVAQKHTAAIYQRFWQVE